jgi:hypothetical protein
MSDQGLSIFDDEPEETPTATDEDATQVIPAA